MSPVCPHLALSPIYTSLCFSLHLYLALLWEITFKDSDNPASSASSLHMKTTHPLLSCYIVSVLLKLSSANSLRHSPPIFSSETQTLLVFPLSLPPWWCSVQSHHGSLRHLPFSRLKTILADIPSPCGYHAENRSYKLSSKVTKTFVCQGYMVPITEQFNCLPVSPSQWIGLTKPFFKLHSSKAFHWTSVFETSGGGWLSTFTQTSEVLLLYLSIWNLCHFTLIPQFREKYSFFHILFFLHIIYLTASKHKFRFLHKTQVQLN